MIGSNNTFPQSSIVTPPNGATRSTPRNYQRVPATYQGNPVLYNAINGDLAYEGLQEGHILSLPKEAEERFRRQLRLPSFTARLTQPGAFVLLAPDVQDFADRRGEVIDADAIGVTLMVTAFGDDLLSTPEVELWPWHAITLLTRAIPTSDDLATLNSGA